jgi:hypothetical protein
MKVIAVITDLPSIRRYLEGTGYSAAIPEIAPARAPPRYCKRWSAQGSGHFVGQIDPLGLRPTSY